MESCTVNGTPCLRIPGNQNGLLVVVIPGNPGLCYYYDAFMTELASQLPPATQIVCSSLRGFDGTMRTVVDLDAQVEHQINVINSFSSPSTPQIAVLGHSVGAWIAQRVSKKCHLVRFVGLLAPTVIDIAKSDRGRIFVRLPILPVLIFLMLLSFIARWLFPRRLVRWLIATFPLRNCAPGAIDASTDLCLSPFSIRQVILMAAEEMRRIGPETEPHDIFGFWKADSFRVWALFSPHDHWVSPKTQERLLDLSRPPRVTIDFAPPSIPHAWCLHHSIPVATLTAQSLLTMLVSQRVSPKPKRPPRT